MSMLACPNCGNTEHGLHAYRGAFRRLVCKGCGKTFNERNAPIVAEDAGRVNGKRFVVTAAVNATKAHAAFIKSLEQYCLERKAQLLVVPMRYKNPTRQDETPEDWWDARLSQYLVGHRTQLADNLLLLADIKVQPTAINPLQGWLTVSGTKHAIIGHTKVALESVATAAGVPAKLVMTTGACTVAQYSDTNAGAKGEFHHTLGAVIVEIDGKNTHMRHVCPLSNGTFIDLDREYSGKGSKKARQASVLTMGDIHAELADSRVKSATERLAALIKPKAIVCHDVLNFGSASHHAGYFERYARHSRGKSSVMKELQVTAQYMSDIAKLSPKVVMVSSNHHDHFTKWLEKSEHAHDLENALVYHETKTAMLRAIYEGGYCDPFQYWMERMTDKPLHWLKPGESFRRHGIEFAYHGHKGPNGARGSTRGFANVGAKVTKGHSHGAQIVDGAHSVGTSSKLDMGYNLDSPSAWTHTHDITYANGKRTLIHCVGGKFYEEQQK